MLHFIVTGGCGFIGSHLVERLLEAECFVTVVDDLRGGSYVVEHPMVRYVHEDVCDVFPAENKIEGIIHLANTPRVRLSFEDPQDAIMNNIGPTTMVAEWAKYHKCPLYFAQSSSTVFSDRFANPYTFGKAISEEALQLYQKHWKIRYHLLYFYNVYGPREADYGPYSTVIRAFKNNVLNGEPLTVFGSGRKSRDFTYVSDVVDGIIKLLRQPKKPKQVHLGAGHPYTINEIAEAFEHNIVYSFDKPGEAQSTLCKQPYVKRTIDALEYIKNWKKKLHDAQINS